MDKDGMKYHSVRILATQKIQVASEMIKIMNDFVSSQFCVIWYINTCNLDTV